MKHALLLVALLFAAPAQAGDRGLYLAFVDARGGDVADARRDALEHALFSCGDRPLPACRRERASGGSHDTSIEPVYGVAPGVIDAPLAVAAERSAAGRRRLAAFVGERGAPLDGLVLYRVAPDGRATLVLVNLNRGRVSRVALPAGDAPLGEAALRAARRFLALGWSL